MNPREHGTVRGYSQHLRDDDRPTCGPCRTAWGAYIAERRANPHPSINPVTVRRRCDGDLTVPLSREETLAAFRALAERGATHAEIARLLGVHERTAQRWARGETKQPHARRAAGAA